MGKKNKKSARVQNSSDISYNNFTSFEDEIIQQLQLLKEAGGLVIGLNAVLRGLEKKSFSVVILISRKATSAMYHALSFMCKNSEVIFLQLQDISSITSYSKLPSSTAYGIKTSVLTENQKFQKLLERIKSARKFPKQRKKIDLNEDDCPAEENSSSECESQRLMTKKENCSDTNFRSLNVDHCDIQKSNCFIHSHPDKQKVISTGKTVVPNPLSRLKSGMPLTGTDKSYLSLAVRDFLDYRTKSGKISFCIK